MILLQGVDMHVHTTASDGIFDAAYLIDLAIGQGICGIAISDHDTVAAVAPAMAYAKAQAENKDFLVVPAIEISAEWQEREIHILGYGIDFESPYLLQELQKLQKEREIRLVKILAKLKEHGIVLDAEKLNAMGEGVIGRAHIARLMVQEKYCQSMGEVFENWLSRKGKAYVTRPKLSPAEAINLVRKAGGVPVMAHPGMAKADAYISTMVELGLGGLEIHHPNHTLEDTVHYEKLADAYGIFKTGGSDCHGDRVGMITTPLETVKAILNAPKHV